MITYKCASCGRIFNPEKHEICPRCGDAVAPSVLTRIERKHTAQRMREEGRLNYDDHCHEDDAWTQSYGAGTHRAAVRSHEAALREQYAAHRAADNPTRLPNANPAAHPATAARTVPGTQSAPGAGKSAKKAPNQFNLLRWIGIAWFLYFLYRAFRGILRA